MIKNNVIYMYVMLMNARIQNFFHGGGGGVLGLFLVNLLCEFDKFKLSRNDHPP